MANLSNNKYFEANIKAWNLKTPIHLESSFYNLESFLSGSTSLNSIELNDIKDVSGKDVLHLQCHFGMDTISWTKLGANCLGVDFSDVSINEAIKLAKTTKVECSFLNKNVYDLNLEGKKFDIIYCSYGALNWLPDLNLWAKIIYNHLKYNGYLYIVDFHPLLIAHDCLESSSINTSYFNNSLPMMKVRQGTYADFNAPIELIEYTWNHSLSEIFNALIQNNMHINMINEYPYLPFNCFPNLSQKETNKWELLNNSGLFPLCFSIKASKH